MSARLSLFSRFKTWLWHSLNGDAHLKNAPNQANPSDFIADADFALAQQMHPHARIIIRTALLSVISLTIWAGFAEIDEVTRGIGKVIPSRQLQVIQSLDGGLVSQILVREGDVVEPKQLLLKVDETRFISSLRENKSQYLSLLAKSARLTALANGTPFVVPAEVAAADPTLLEQERQLYESRQTELNGNLGIARDQMNQRQQELNEVRARRDQAIQGYESTAKELNVTRPLLAAGAVSEVELLRLERDVARYRGERDVATAQMAKLQSAISEAASKIREVELNFKNQSRNELAEVAAKIGGLSEGSVALSDRVKHASIVSPVRGTVKRIFVNTVGGVIQPGKDLIEIVPLQGTLLLEARINPKDIAFLHPGQKALVKFTAYDYSIYGGLEGTLEQIGADTVLDEKGNAYYVVRVRTAKPALGKNLPILPGMVAEIDIQTGKKTILSYLLKPVLKAKHYAMTER